MGRTEQIERETVPNYISGHLLMKYVTLELRSIVHLRAVSTLDTSTCLIYPNLPRRQKKK